MFWEKVGLKIGISRFGPFLNFGRKRVTSDNFRIAGIKMNLKVICK